MKKVIFFDGQDFLEDDANTMQDDIETGILTRTQDLWGSTAGFANGGLLSGGAVTVNINPQKIDVSAAIGYTGLGDRINSSPFTAVVLADLTGGPNFIFLTYANFTDTPVAHPVTGVINNTRQEESFTITVSTTNTPTADQVVLAEVVYQGGVGPLVITDLRVFPRALGTNVVDTDQIVNHAVTILKVADYLKPIVWQQNPDLWFDKDTNTLIARKQGAFSIAGIAGFSVLSTGLPLTLNPDPATTGISQVIIGTLNGLGAVAVSAIPCAPGFDFTTLAKVDVIVLGVVDNNDSFIAIQAPESDEIFGMTEDDYSVIGFSSRHRPEENLWRRTNEGFQSYTPPVLDDGTVQPNGNLVVISGGGLKVTLGTSYVAGRRIPLLADVTLSSGNTDNFALLAGFTGNIDVYEFRNQLALTKRFRVQTPGIAPLNAYWLATVAFVAGVPTVVTDRREFNPVEAVSTIFDTSQGTKIGARLKNATNVLDVASKIYIEPGVIGFADGTVRTNKVAKFIDFSATFEQSAGLRIVDADQPSGQLQTNQTGVGGISTPTALEKQSVYAIFATADHSGQEWNVVAAKLSFYRGISGAPGSPGQYVYTFPVVGNIPLNRQYYPGQKIIAKRYDVTPTSTTPTNTGVNDLGANNYTPDNVTNPEVVLSVSTTTVTTQGGVPGLTTTPTFSGGTFTIQNKLRPDPVLTGISKHFRLLGFVLTNGNSVTPTLRTFIAVDSQVQYTDNSKDNVDTANLGNGPNNPLSNIQYTANTTTGYNKDLGLVIPPPCRKALFQVMYSAIDPLANAGARAFATLGAPGRDQQVITIQLQGSPFTLGSNGQETMVWAEVDMNVATMGFSQDVPRSMQIPLGYVAAAGFEFNVFDEWGLQNIDGSFIP